MSDLRVSGVPEHLVGLNGWFRWSTFAAHYFVEGVQQCATEHGKYMGSCQPTTPKGMTLTPEKIPYGIICNRCLKAFWRIEESKTKADKPCVVKWNDRLDEECEYEVTETDGWVNATQTSRFGKDDFGTMHPEDARQMAKALVEAAEAAEKHERWRR